METYNLWIIPWFGVGPITNILNQMCWEKGRSRFGQYREQFAISLGPGPTYG